jgi:cell surface protein SprA
MRVFSMDQLNFANDTQTGVDGFFDFVPGLTIDQQNGRIIFTKVEPFGRYLFEKLRTSPGENYCGDPILTSDFNANQNKYAGSYISWSRRSCRRIA